MLSDEIDWKANAKRALDSDFNHLTYGDWKRVVDLLAKAMREASWSAEYRTRESVYLDEDDVESLVASELAAVGL